MHGDQLSNACTVAPEGFRVHRQYGALPVNREPPPYCVFSVYTSRPVGQIYVHTYIFFFGLRTVCQLVTPTGDILSAFLMPSLPSILTPEALLSGYTYLVSTRPTVFVLI